MCRYCEYKPEKLELYENQELYKSLSDERVKKLGFKRVDGKLFKIYNHNPIITPNIMSKNIFKDFDYLNPLGTHETTGITLLIGNMEAPEYFTIVITMP